MNTCKKTHIGRRSSNQDYLELFYNQNGQLLAILCDGMGGHKAGDIASEMAVIQLGHQWEETAFTAEDKVKTWLDHHINLENQRIYRVAKSYDDLEGMGTTLVTAAFIGDKILIGNIGDSRAYQLNSQTGHLDLITIDHSFANELQMSGEITAEEAKTHRQRHTLTRSLGVYDKVNVDFFLLEREETDLLLLCSDGLSNGLDIQSMQAVLSKETHLDRIGESLVLKALENGSTDNISLCLIQEDRHRKGGE
ncbi:Protein serine/threonine phosphatase PrpC, regulation of stationary phase [Alkalibacterium sp. AK22]|uniref:Stp1/IreP family PP2C-type Ser/Thr phosphatase n=1 Tax=Alkalibacterium sp. AK22 TaxID=1229520 RepID=UPI00044A8930|nr:Stp1/IreP family PP2C-type Ser/Thr phosphatase [Alkalibacterium sp. AK22]EXJ24227.1 Protein serine/threonine phosphatase PrpC, regulation of stationary phase [Alkalibacterium sp. AK22]